MALTHEGLNFRSELNEKTARLTLFLLHPQRETIIFVTRGMPAGTYSGADNVRRTDGTAAGYTHEGATPSYA